MIDTTQYTQDQIDAALYSIEYRTLPSNIKARQLFYALSEEMCGAASRSGAYTYDPITAEDRVGSHKLWKLYKQLGGK